MRDPHRPQEVDPVEFCRLLKLVDREPPRLSRDLEPDLLGIQLKHQVLDAYLNAPPTSPAEFPAALLDRAATIAAAAGAVRGVCSDVLLEWQMACTSAGFMDWLRHEAVNPPAPRRRRREERAGEPAWTERSKRGFGPSPDPE